jgi:hypothetical protein
LLKHLVTFTAAVTGARRMAVATDASIAGRRHGETRVTPGKGVQGVVVVR